LYLIYEVITRKEVQRHGRQWDEGRHILFELLIVRFVKKIFFRSFPRAVT